MMKYFLRIIRRRLRVRPSAERSVRRRVRRRVLGRGLRGHAREYAIHKETARAIVHERLEHFNAVYNFTYNKIAIRNQKSRWGSASKKGNLNFHYKIALLPPHLADYIIVHELCHLGAFNHSRQFWSLVGKALPDHKERRRELKRVEKMKK